MQRYALLALLAAALFGISTPLAKALIGDSSPWLLAGLLYLGSGSGLTLVWLVRRANTTSTSPALAAGDWPALAGAVLAGGIIAPVLLMTGLAQSTASSAALLLNLEGVLTTVLAVLLFREAVAARIWWGVALTVLAGALLSWTDGVLSWQALAVAGACFFWAIDNNVTRKISANDAVLLALIKGLVAGVVNVTIALALGATMPDLPKVTALLLLGFFCYGLSLVLFVLALRHLGSARTAAHFSTAPFLGAAVAIVLLGEPLTLMFVLAFALMLVATWLVLTEQHSHEHHHERLVHRHPHCHDDHHQHGHDGSEGPEPHDHEHVHEPITHRHSHLPDIHHRHEH
ncbi:DMT family transporter [Permianibacter sp. IMCC34836]|uniref:DMT family transporter n=1 Tax=Permianibacter fluminis TaxID=2738515 RepID=UPI001554FBCD|nr:DMT family transporter [Permianibacter fluminis]NQD38263.1 DMT family transporter [Permianibacter fluminis]